MTQDARRPEFDPGEVESQADNGHSGLTGVLPPPSEREGAGPVGIMADKAEKLVNFVVNTIDDLIDLLETESRDLHAMDLDALTRFHARKHNLIGQYEEALHELRADHMPALSQAMQADLRDAMEDLRQAVERHDQALQAVTQANQSVLTEIAKAVSRSGNAGQPTTYDRGGRTSDSRKPKPMAGYLNDTF